MVSSQSDPFTRDASRVVALRRCVLAVSVIDGFDLLPGDAFITFECGQTVALGWDEVDLAVGDIDPDTPLGRSRLGNWLKFRAALTVIDQPARRLRVVGLPRGHVLHPGPAWVRHAVGGAALDLGLGMLGLFEDPDEVIVLPPALVTAAGMDALGEWADLVYSLEQTGRLAAERLASDPGGPLRPFGDFDVVTLLGSTAFRAELCESDPVGWRSAAVPMRQRGWLDLGRIDPAFAAAAALATEPTERGFDRALLVTPEEIVLVPSGGQAAAHALQDPPASLDPWERGS
ncbi:MAG TPA: hypothetical protein VMT88_07910 [Actinomycetes bacterium]|nr:hypothetical protein [Actinomycetes bacterium]